MVSEGVRSGNLSISKSKPIVDTDHWKPEGKKPWDANLTSFQLHQYLRLGLFQRDAEPFMWCFAIAGTRLRMQACLRRHTSYYCLGGTHTSAAAVCSSRQRMIRPVFDTGEWLAWPSAEKVEFEFATTTRNKRVRRGQRDTKK